MDYSEFKVASCMNLFRGELLGTLYIYVILVSGAQVLTFAWFSANFGFKIVVHGSIKCIPVC